MLKKVANVGVAALAREVGVSAPTISLRMKRGQTADQIRREFAARKGQAPRKKNSDGPGSKPTTKSEYDMLIEGRARFDGLQLLSIADQHYFGATFGGV